MVFRELQTVLNPSENISVIYRDPARGLNYRKLYTGRADNCQENRLKERRVVMVSSAEIEKNLFIEVE